MKAGWEVKPLKHVASLLGGGTPSKQKPEFWGGDIPWVSPKDMTSDIITDTEGHITGQAIERSSTKRIPEGSLLIVVRSGILARTVPTAISGREVTINQDLKAIVPNCRLDRKFLAHFFRASESYFLDKVTRGATVHKLDTHVITSLPVPLPPLEEQQRIVAVLDEAFEGLSCARAHAEANLVNARELFDSALNEAFHTERSDWRTLTVADTLTRTKVPAKIQRKAYLEEGAFPIVSQEARLINGYWNNEVDVIHLKRPVVVFGDHTRVLKYVDFDFVVGADGTQILAPVECLVPRYYYYALKKIDLEGKGYARHFSHLKKCVINFPNSIEAQQRIATRLDNLSANTHDLEKQYDRTLQDLDDLRQSLLQKAFAGELTSGSLPR